MGNKNSVDTHQTNGITTLKARETNPDFYLT